jgi:hypothetical protein
MLPDPVPPKQSSEEEQHVIGMLTSGDLDASIIPGVLVHRRQPSCRSSIHRQVAMKS